MVLCRAASCAAAALSSPPARASVVPVQLSSISYPGVVSLTLNSPEKSRASNSTLCVHQFHKLVKAKGTFQLKIQRLQTCRHLSKQLVFFLLSIKMHSKALTHPENPRRRILRVNKRQLARERERAVPACSETQQH